MTLYSVALGLTVAANLWLLGFVALRANRRLPKRALLLFLAAFSASHVGTIALLEGGTNATWAGLAFATLVLGYTALALFVLSFLYGEGLRRRIPMVAGIVVPGILIAGLGAYTGWLPSQAFEPATDPVSVGVNGYLVACIAIALAESLAVWRRSPARAREAFPLVLGSVGLIIAGPIYGFELVVFRFTELTGTNLAVPFAAALFTIALMRGNPLPFRGRTPEGPRPIPWMVPAGTYLLDEARPKYAQAMFLAASHGSPALAILSEPDARVPDLAGVEKVHVPAASRCAAVLAGTVSEFLHRHPTGVVLVNDLSYAVANSGLAITTDALRRCVAGKPAGGRLVVSLAALTEEERSALAVTGTVRVSAPDVEAELAAILTTHVGAATDSLRRAALARGKRIEDLTVLDVPHVRDFVLASLADFRGSSDHAAESGWGRVSETVAAEFESLWRTSPMERPAQRERRTAPAEELSVVRAAEALPPSVTAKAPRQSLGTAVRDAFLGALGPAGEPVYRRVMGALRRDAATLRPEDLPKVAELAEAALADLGGAIDVDDAKRDLLERTRRLQAQLTGLARGDP